MLELHASVNKEHSKNQLSCRSRGNRCGDWVLDLLEDGEKSVGRGGGDLERLLNGESCGSVVGF